MLINSDFILVIIGRIATALIGIASLRVMTTVLAPSEYGQWALLIAFQTFGCLFMINPIDQHVFRYAHAWRDNGNLLSYLARYNDFVLTVSLIIGVSVMIWWNFKQINQADSSVLGVSAGFAVGITVYLGTCNVGLNYLLNMLGFRNLSVIWTTVSALIGLGCSALLVLQYPHATTWLFGQSIGAGFGALGAWRSLIRHSPKGTISRQKLSFTDFLPLSTLRRFCVPLAAATGFMWLQNTGYRFWVGDSLGVSGLGILVAGLGVSAQLATIVESLAMQYLYPFMARRIVDANSDLQIGAALADMMNVLAPVYAIWAGFNAVCAGALLQLLTDARYHVAVPYVIFGAMIEYARCTTNLWSNTARATRQTKGLILPYGIGAGVVCFATIGALHFKLDLNGFSTILVVSGFLTSITMAFAMQRLLPIHIAIPRIVTALCIMVLCFFMAIYAPIKVIGLQNNLYFLFSSAFIAFCLVFSMLYNNHALKRLLSATL